LGNKPRFRKEAYPFEYKQLIPNSTSSLKEHVFVKTPQLKNYFDLIKYKQFMRIENFGGHCKLKITCYFLKRNYYSEDYPQVYLFSVQPQSSKTIKYKITLSSQDIAMIA
jgi:hypothetical protein